MTGALVAKRTWRKDVAKGRGDLPPHALDVEDPQRRAAAAGKADIARRRAEDLVAVYDRQLASIGAQVIAARG